MGYRVHEPNRLRPSVSGSTYCDVSVSLRQFASSRLNTWGISAARAAAPMAPCRPPETPPPGAADPHEPVGEHPLQDASLRPQRRRLRLARIADWVSGVSSGTGPQGAGCRRLASAAIAVSQVPQLWSGMSSPPLLRGWSRLRMAVGWLCVCAAARPSVTARRSGCHGWPRTRVPAG